MPKVVSKDIIYAWYQLIEEGNGAESIFTNAY